MSTWGKMMGVGVSLFRWCGPMLSISFFLASFNQNLFSGKGEKKKQRHNADHATREGTAAKIAHVANSLKRKLRASCHSANFPGA